MYICHISRGAFRCGKHTKFLLADHFVPQPVLAFHARGSAGPGLSASQVAAVLVQPVCKRRPLFKRLPV